jgi:hypothetical protein
MAGYEMMPFFLQFPAIDKIMNKKSESQMPAPRVSEGEAKPLPGTSRRFRKYPGTALY